MSYRQRFAERVRAREALAGTFVKSRDPAIVEILGHAGFDFAILDAEHVAYSRADIAAMLVASRAVQLPTLVRVPQTDGHWIATCLDAGAAGIMAPQVQDAAMATGLASAMRYGGGGLGFSPSTPGADYGGRGIAGHLAQQPKEVVLICQIESPDAVANAGTIAAVDGVDGLLIGPVDLAVSAGFTDPAAPEVTAMTETTVAAGAQAGKAAGLFIGNPAAAPGWKAKGATLFVLGSDQSYLLQGAKAALGSLQNS